MAKIDELKESVMEKVKQDDVKFINLQFTDILGAIKSVTIPVEMLEESLERGTWFDGSSIEGFARIHESDMILRPDLSTYAVLPWRPKESAEARFICDVHKPNGKPFEGDPRYILKQAIEKAEKMGFVYNTGPELEFFLFRTDNGKLLGAVPHDTGGYFDYSARDLATDVRRDIVLSLESFGMSAEMSHHEVAAGQHEIDVKYSDALKSADNVITLKQTIKAHASLHELYASFMPKPIFGINGSGMHVHQSLFYKKTGDTAFFDAKDPYKLSKAAYGFIAGQLEHAREFSGVVAPTVNSYKRLVPGYEAPVYICWGSINRSALIRIPAYSQGREKSMRAELRCPDPSCSPYLAFAVMLLSGLDGIKRKLNPGKPIEEDVYEFDDSKLKQLYIDTLPGSLGDAIEEMEKSKLVKEALGDHTYKNFIRAKRMEWNEFRIQVTEWELKKYFEIH